MEDLTRWVRPRVLFVFGSHLKSLKRLRPDLAFAVRVLGDIGEPQQIGAVDGEITFHEVFFGGLVDHVLLVFLGPGRPLMPSSRLIEESASC